MTRTKTIIKAEVNPRNMIRSSLASGVGALWLTPVVVSVTLPAHAQTSGMADSIIVSSLDVDNPFARYVLIVDASDNVLANCGASGGTATAQNLLPGTYRIFSDSDGAQNQVFTISTGAQTATVTVPTNTSNCDLLVATIELPAGTITTATGQAQTSTWNCNTNLGTGCS